MENNLNLYNDKYDASKSVKDYLIWLVQTGQAEILQGWNNIHTYNPFSKKYSTDTSTLTSEECLRALQSGRDRYTFQCKFQDKVYNISFGDSGSYYYREEFGGLEEFFEDYVSRLKESGEYYLPETEIPRYTAPKTGSKIIKVDEENYIVADRKEVYTQLSGEPIFKDSFILTDDKSIVYGSGEKELFSDMIHTKVEDSDYKETETFIGYNDNQVMFIQDQGRAYYRKMLSSDSIQKFEREDVESPVLMFSVGDTTGFIDGRKVRVSNKDGELSTFEIEEDIQSVDIKNGYVLINGNILCCGMRYKQNKWDIEEKILPFCKKINNPEKMELFMKEHDNIQKDSFIENENGCVFMEGLTEEEKLRTYKEYGFKELHAELESTIIKRQERQREEERKIEETRRKTNEYLEGKLLSICHIRRYSSSCGKIIEADDVEFVENDDAVILYEKQERGWSYGPVYETGIINMSEARNSIEGSKLHLDVPEELMGIIVGKQGSNINQVTRKLREKGINVSRIILHPKSREEIKIRLESIEKAIKGQKAQSHED